MFLLIINVKFMLSNCMGSIYGMKHMKAGKNEGI